MAKSYRVFNLDTRKSLYVVKPTAYQAMEALIYYLNLSHLDKDAKIQLCGGGRTLSVVHNREMWGCIND